MIPRLAAANAQPFAQPNFRRTNCHLVTDNNRHTDKTAIGNEPTLYAHVHPPVLRSHTPGSGEHGPRFLTGGPGAAPGGVASKNGWVYMRVQRGVISYSPVCPYSGIPSVCCYKTAVGVENGLLERLRVCRGGSRNQLRGLKEGGLAMRGAMLCLPADLTSHAVSTCQLLTL